jgi:hypothetical protein
MLLSRQPVSDLHVDVAIQIVTDHAVQIDSVIVNPD